MKSITNSEAITKGSFAMILLTVKTTNKQTVSDDFSHIEVLSIHLDDLLNS